MPRLVMFFQIHFQKLLLSLKIKKQFFKTSLKKMTLIFYKLIKDTSF